MPLFTSIGLALGATVAASAGAGIGAFGVGVIAAAITGAGVAASSAASAHSANIAGKKSQNQLRLPQTPTVANAELQAKNTAREKIKAASRSQSVYTSPLGLTEEAGIARKTLLGE